MLGWLFRRQLDREEAVALAVRFLEAEGCRVVFGTYEKCECGAARVEPFEDRLIYLLVGAELPYKRWYVRFLRVLPPGWWTSHQDLTVWVHSETGVVEYPH